MIEGQWHLLVGLFDRFKPERNFVVAPHLHD
jgi:hypothetical protein